MEKQIASLNLDLEELGCELKERENKLALTDSEYKSTLERNFVIENELRSLQLRQKDHENAIHSYRQQIAHLESEK